MGRVVKFISLIVAAISLSCCYDHFGEEGADLSSATPLANITIAELVSGLQTEKLIIYDDLVIRGSVTSTDRNGNFYKTFVIEEDGYGIEILEGLYASYVRHDLGCVVSVDLKGLTLSSYAGVHQVGLGAADGSYYTLDYLSLESVIDAHIYPSDTYEYIEPHLTTISSLTESMCGRLIKIASLQHLPGEDATQPYTWSGYQEFVDEDGASVWCYASDYTSYYDLPIPTTTLSLCGVLLYTDDTYFLEMRGVEDCVAE